MLNNYAYSSYLGGFRTIKKNVKKLPKDIIHIFNYLKNNYIYIIT